MLAPGQNFLASETQRSLRRTKTFLATESTEGDGKKLGPLRGKGKDRLHHRGTKIKKKGKDFYRGEQDL